MAVIVTTVLAMVTLTLADQGVNLIRNPSFEEELGDTWGRTSRFTMTREPGQALHGQSVLRCADRTKDLAGPSQALPQLTPGRGYELRAYVRLLNDDPDKLWQQLKAVVSFAFKDGDTLPKRSPSCRGAKGPDRKVCMAKRKDWKREMRKRKALARQAKKDRAKGRKESKQEKKRDKRNKKKKEKKDKARKSKDKKEKKRAEKKMRKERAKKEKLKERKEKKGLKERAKKEKQKERKERKGLKERAKKEKLKKRKEKEELKERARKERREKKGLKKRARKEGRRLREERVKGRRREREAKERRRRSQGQPTLWDDADVATGPERNPRAGRERRAGRRKPKPSRSGPSLSTGAYIIAWRAFVTSQQGWVALVGDINAPMKPFTDSVLYIRGPDPGIDFLLDNVTLLEIPERSDWLAESEAMIDKNRKSDLTLTVNLPTSINAADIDVQVKLKSHLFAFGSKVEDDLLRSRKMEHFRRLFFNLFNWATIGSFKWRFDKSPDLYQPDFSNALEALDVLLSNGIKVRAHSILWGVEKNIPEMVLATPPEDLPRLLRHHTEYMVNITKGRVEHWDVQNELLHGQWYEETLKDPTLSQRIFQIARPLDPHVKLFLNDFTAVTSGANTEDYHDTALRFINAGTGIQGLGIQGHVKEFVKPDPTMIWKRLDRLAETGLDLFMTEFDVGWDNEAERADWFEDAMRAFFAHPGLSGVILWGFWREQQRYKNKYLVYSKNGNDDDLRFSEQGRRYVCLVKKEWTTNESFNLARGRSLDLRAFQGHYQVVVRRNSVPVQTETFTLGKRSETVNIQITENQERVDMGDNDDADYLRMCESPQRKKRAEADHVYS